MPASSNARKGRAGEDRAAAFLEQAGYRIVRRNLRLPGGEIDLVCRDRDTIVFVEVKFRTTGRFGSALSAVSASKRETLRRLAADFVQIVAPNAHFRFDVVAVDGERMTLHRNAF
ncbi:MAG TPA: YraN family protein [Candidatus Baltobacteraceae bacterium]|nr:YraN family protein [Candidatus Baltobacteraceae bacterium]